MKLLKIMVLVALSFGVMAPQQASAALDPTASLAEQKAEFRGFLNDQIVFYRSALPELRQATRDKTLSFAERRKARILLRQVSYRIALLNRSKRLVNRARNTRFLNRLYEDKKALASLV